MMKITQFMTGSSIDYESRKRAQQRKEMGEAYKKTAQYQSSKNPMLEMLENLLSGKTEKDLHAADQEKSDAANFEIETENQPAEKSEFIYNKENLEPEVKAEIRELEVTQKEVIAHEQAHKSVGGEVTGPVSYTYTTGPDDKRYINGGEVSIHISEGSTPEETIKILEKVRAAALAPAEPSPQDLRVAASASSQIQQTRLEIADDEYELASEGENEPYAGVDTNVEVPERFLNDFTERNAQTATLFGQDLESLIFKRTFTKATSNYINHIAMVKNGYKPFEEPIFSRTA